MDCKFTSNMVENVDVILTCIAHHFGCASMRNLLDCVIRTGATSSTRHEQTQMRARIFEAWILQRSVVT